MVKLLKKIYKKNSFFENSYFKIYNFDIKYMLVNQNRSAKMIFFGVKEFFLTF